MSDPEERLAVLKQDMRLLLPLLLLFGCAAPPPPPEVCSEPGQSQLMVVTEVSFPREEDNVTLGFDLDGAVSNDGGSTGCGVGDQTGPDGAPGIDNSFARLRPALDATEAAALEEIVQEAILQGGMLLMIELTGVQDPIDDACIGMEISGGAGTPMVSGLGSILPGQTFDRDPEIPVSRVDSAQLSGGVVQAGPISAHLSFRFLDADVVFTLNGGVIRLERQSDELFTGLMGGGVSIEQLSALAHNTGIAPEVEVLLDSLLSYHADLAPDAEGDCQEISVSIRFTAVGAYFYD